MLFTMKTTLCLAVLLGVVALAAAKNSTVFVQASGWVLCICEQHC